MQKMKKLITLSFLFYFNFSWAQNDSTTGEDSGNVIKEQTQDEEPRLEEIEIIEANGIASESGEAEGQEENSNSRFIPTEQISQDLGVSFPVDI
tara:strand:+ start:236 stop:517 length:282 start_codon:yes stop_codon:yes gene_type:complete